MKLIDLTCPKCGATLQANEELSTCTCNFCGNQFAIEKSLEAEQQGYDFEKGRKRFQEEEEKRISEARAREAEMEYRKREESRNTWYPIVGTISLLLALICFITGASGAGFFFLIPAALLLPMILKGE